MTDVNDDAKGVFRRVEVLTGPGRRRHWSDAQKAQVVAEAMVPGAVIAQIARRWQICSAQVFSWRRAALRAASVSASVMEPAFVPIIEAATVPGSFSPSPAAARVVDIEIEFGGAKVRVGSGTDSRTLTTVLRAVRAASL